MEYSQKIPKRFLIFFHKNWIFENLFISKSNMICAEAAPGYYGPQCFFLRNFGSGLSGYCFLEPGGYNHKHGHLLTSYTKNKLDKTNGYFLFGGATYLAIVGYILYVNSG